MRPAVRGLLLQKADWKIGDRSCCCGAASVELLLLRWSCFSVHGNGNSIKHCWEACVSCSIAGKHVCYSSCNSFDKVKAEKASAMRRYNRLRTIARLFRLTELTLRRRRLPLLDLHSPASPSPSAYSPASSRALSSCSSIVCNAIIVSLFAKSFNVTASAVLQDPNDDVAGDSAQR